jgi:hypothetical protein
MVALSIHRDPFQDFRVIILRTVHTRTDRPDRHFVGRIRQQYLFPGFTRLPCVQLVFRQGYRHPGMKPAQKNVGQKKPAPDKTKSLPLLKETPQTSLIRKKPAPKATPDKVENLAKEYLAELKEVDVTFGRGTAALEKYRAKYPELASYIREIAPGEHRIEIRQRLEGEDVGLHLFAIRVLEDEARYEVKLSGDAEHKTVKPAEWLSLLHDKLARIVAKILYARETPKPGKQDLDLSGPAA